MIPERGTKPCSRRFRPGDRFSELSFRYLSPGSEGDKCRPPDHVWQAFHSLSSVSDSICVTVFYLLPISYLQVWLGTVQIWQLHMVKVLFCFIQKILGFLDFHILHENKTTPRTENSSRKLKKSKRRAVASSGNLQSGDFTLLSGREQRENVSK